MTPLTTVTGRAYPLGRKNVDTDVIIRIERLTELPMRALPADCWSIRSIPGRANIAGCRCLTCC